MTATFNRPGKLITPLYSIVKFSSTGKLDAEAQRLLRIGHDFGLYAKPEGYRMDVACPQEEKLEDLKKYLALESEMFEEQEEDPKKYREFLLRLGKEIESRSLLGHRIGKPGLSTDGIAGTKPNEDKSDKKWADIAEGKRPIGCTWDGKSPYWNIDQREENVLGFEDRIREHTRVPLGDWKTAKKICENRAAFEAYRDNVKKSKRQRAIREPTAETPPKKRKGKPVGEWLAMWISNCDGSMEEYESLKGSNQSKINKIRQQMYDLYPECKPKKKERLRSLTRSITKITKKMTKMIM